MSGHIGQRLYTAIWRRARPFSFSLDSQACPQYFAGTSANRSHIFRDVLRGGWVRRISTSPRNARQKARHFASGGFLVLGSSHSTAAVESGASCTIAAEKIACHGAQGCLERRSIQGLAASAWKRSVHTSSSDDSKPRPAEEKPASSESTSSSRPRSSEAPERQNEEISTRPSKDAAGRPVNFNHHFMDRLPHMQRPTKEELLAAATGFWARLKVRFKWFSIRSVRPFNADEIGAFFSWFLLGHVLWIILGTTTFFSLLIFAINTVFAQGKVNSRHAF